MLTILIFAGTLFVAVLFSSYVERSPVSIAGLFLAVGFVSGQLFTDLDIDNELVALFARLALFSVLFTEGLNLDLHELIASRHLPGRALLLGLPLTLVIIAAIVRWVMGFTWVDSLIVAAALSPTDPVFAASLVNQPTVPQRLRHLLNIESGLNDGLALPIVVVLTHAAKSQQADLLQLIVEVTLGILIGIVVPWLAFRVENSRLFASKTSLYNPLDSFAVGLFILALTNLLHANEFLAAFAAGITLATIDPHARDQFRVFGARVAELLKLAALLVFGALISIQGLNLIGLQGILVALLVLLAARPIGLSLALLGSGLDWREWFAAAWFGPRGFASVFYGLYLLRTGITDASRLFHLIAVVTVISMIAHSSTDVFFARWFKQREQREQVQTLAASASARSEQ